MLFNLEPHEISLVGQGANMRQYLVFKSKAGTPEGDDSNKGALMPSDPITKAFGRPPPPMKRPAAPPATPARPGQAIPAAAGTAPDAQATPEPPKPAAPAPPTPAPAPAAAAPPAALPPSTPPTPTAASQGIDPTADQQASISPPAEAAMRATARILAPFRGEITMSDLQGLAEALGIVDDTCEPQEEGEPEYIAMSVESPQNAGVAQEHHQAAIDEAKSAYVASLIAKGYNVQNDATSGDDTMADTAAAAQDTKAQPSVEAVRKEYESRLELVEKQLQAEREVRKNQEYVAKAAAYPRVGSAEQRVAILKALDAAPEVAKEFEAVLKSVEAQFKDADEGKGIMTEHGSRAGGAGTEGGDARAKLEALADGLVQKDMGKMTREQAIVQIYKSKEGRELLRQERAEKADLR